MTPSRAHAPAHRDERDNPGTSGTVVSVPRSPSATSSLMDNPSRSPDSGAAADPEHVRQPGPDENDDVRLRRRAIGVVVAYFLLDGIMRSGYFHFGARAEGLAHPGGG